MEEIIIDGVDVSGCEQRIDIHKNLLADGSIKEFSNYCYFSNDGCYGINCYYKQLKRKEAECEKLKDINTSLVERLIMIDDEELMVVITLEEKEQYDKYKQALEKIEEVCKCSKEPMNCDKCPQCGDCEELCVNDENLQDIILQIIEECKE